MISVPEDLAAQRDAFAVECAKAIQRVCAVRRAVLALPIALVACANRMNATARQDGFIDAGSGVRLYYRVDGSAARAVVVLHGGPGFTHDYLADDLLPLADARRVIHYDQRGSGRSTLVSGAAALDASHFANDLEAVRLHFGIERLSLLGHSWGAGVAALYAMLHPQRVERLVLVGPMPLRRDELDKTFARIRESGDAEWRRELQARGQALMAAPGDEDACRAYYRTWFTPVYGHAAARARTRGSFCAGTAESRRNKVVNVDRYTVSSLGAFDWRGALGAVKAPVLVVHGDADVISPSSAREWAAAFPNARLALLAGVGHFPFVESPEQFFPVVNAFLAGL